MQQLLIHVARVLRHRAPVAFPSDIDLFTCWPTGRRTFYTPLGLVLLALVPGFGAWVWAVEAADLPGFVILFMVSALSLAVWCLLTWWLPQAEVHQEAIEHVGLGDWIVTGQQGSHTPLFEVAAGLAHFVHDDSMSSPHWVGLTNGMCLKGPPETSVQVARVWDPWARWRLTPREPDATELGLHLLLPLLRLLGEVSSDQRCRGDLSVEQERVILRLRSESNVKAAEVRAAIASASHAGLIAASGVRRPRLTVTEAGHVWYVSVMRQKGVGAVPDAARGDGHVNIHIGAPVGTVYTQVGNQNSMSVSVGDELRVVRHAAEVVRAALPSLGESLSRDELSQLSAALRAVDDDDEVAYHTPGRLRQAASTMLRIAGSVVLGAGGNGLYEALRKVAGS